MDYTELWTKRTSNHTNKKIEKNKIKGKGCRKENGRKKKKKFDFKDCEWYMKNKRQKGTFVGFLKVKSIY